MLDREKARRAEQSRQDRQQNAREKKYHLRDQNISEKIYLRVKGLRRRYGDVCEKTIERWRKSGLLPKPDFYHGPIPFWSTGRLDESDQQHGRSA